MQAQRTEGRSRSEDRGGVRSKREKWDEKGEKGEGENPWSTRMTIIMRSLRALHAHEEFNDSLVAEY